MTTLLLSKRTLKILLVWGGVFLTSTAIAQSASNSVYVNFGRQSCDDSYLGSDLTLVAAAQTSTPDLILQCNTTTPIGDIFSKFVSYNAINNKLYINDYSDYTNSNIYILNIGIPSNVTCPALALSYTIPDVILNQFEFDPNGDLYALSNYDQTSGTADIGAYDDTTGSLIIGSQKTLYFPSGHFPNDVYNGDIAILPNGRMFCIFGGDTSKFFEITNYQKTVTGNAVARYLGAPSLVCYGLAFDNGYLLMGGTDLDGHCYSYTYNLITDVLSDEISSPLNTMPIDATSFSPSIGAGTKLVSATQVDANHYDLVYNIYLKNLGNVKVGTSQVKFNLAAVFGAGNISNVASSFVSNGAGFSLNTLYDGSSTSTLLTTSQLANYPSNKTTSIIEVQVTVANPIPYQIYKISAIFTAKIGKDSTLLQLKDSSNNYSTAFSSWIDVADPNKNAVADDPGEGVPTPWSIGTTLPIQLSSFDVQPANGGALLNWSTLSESDTRYFAIERSSDAHVFDSIGIVTGYGTSTSAHDYSFSDKKPPMGTIYYRLRQTNSEGSPNYSDVRVLELQSQVTNYLIYPNPASNYVVFESTGSSESDLTLSLSGLYGSSVFNKSIQGETLREQISLPQLPNGFYTLTIKNSDGATRFYKISILN